MEEPEARYANYFQIGQNAFEVILGFGQHYEDIEQPHMHTRIVVTPEYAKALLDLLKTAMAEYEQSYGKLL